MSYYYNPNFEASPSTQSGPYEFKHGIIKASDDGDAVVGHILTNFYGCTKISKEEAVEILKKQKAQNAADVAETAAEAAKAAAEAAEAVKAAAEAEAAAKAAEVEKQKSSKPEDKM